MNEPKAQAHKMGVLGVDPFDYSPRGKALLNELQKVGFRLKELEYAETVLEEGAGWYILFGAPALKEFCGDYKMEDVSGQLMHCSWNEDALIVPNYAPGFVYYNKNLKPLWIENLQQALLYWKLDEKGVIA